jgi:hypothetical protein
MAQVAECLPTMYNARSSFPSAVKQMNKQINKPCVENSQKNSEGTGLPFFHLVKNITPVYS